MLNFQVHFGLYGQENYVFGGEFQYEFLNVSQTFYAFFFFCAKEKSQNAPLFEMDFVLNFAMCHFFKRAGEREVELRHVDSRSLIGQFYFLLVPNMVLSKRIITSIGQSKHMRVTRFNSL